jgi:hypothetical protein
MPLSSYTRDTAVDPVQLIQALASTLIIGAGLRLTFQTLVTRLFRDATTGKRDRRSERVDVLNAYEHAVPGDVVGEACAYLLRQLVERLIPTRPDHRAGTVQRPGCLRAALLVHRGCPTRRPYRCHARRRRAEDDAQKHAGRIDSGRLGSALTLRLETWKLPSWSRCWPVPTIAARTCRGHPDDDPPVQVGCCVRAAVLPRRRRSNSPVCVKH